MGVELLKKSKYDPAAMADFMLILQKREQNGEIANIEYFRTHPVSSNRIAEIRARLANVAKKRSPLLRYQQFRDYLFYVYPDGVIRTAGRSRFSQALEHTRNGRYDIAGSIYEELSRQDPDSLWYKYASAENLEYQGRIGEAALVYESALLVYPDELSIGLRLTNVYMTQKKFDQALARALQLLKSHPDQFIIYESLVKAYSALNNEPLRKFAEANYHWYSGNRELAKKQFKALISEGVLDAPNEQRAKEKLDSRSVEAGLLSALYMKQV